MRSDLFHFIFILQSSVAGRCEGGSKVETKRVWNVLKWAEVDECRYEETCVSISVCVEKLNWHKVIQVQRYNFLKVKPELEQTYLQHLPKEEPWFIYLFLWRTIAHCGKRSVICSLGLFTIVPHAHLHYSEASKVFHVAIQFMQKTTLNWNKLSL